MTRLARLRANLRARIAAARSRANWRSTFYGTTPELIAEIDRTLLSHEIAEGLAAIRAERRAVARQHQQGA